MGSSVQPDISSLIYKVSQLHDTSASFAKFMLDWVGMGGGFLFYFIF